ncbi:DUF429 domain-containing protein [Streptosporangium sp. NPDC006930]|uniref:DUF429 domain-containing protein n=1 Tax=Streptosporangium sp. NPDC006930 TaxID=3154783 RepID=UPI00342A2C6A
MLTVGVDLATKANKTAVAWLDWSADRARVRRLEIVADDDLIVEAIKGADKAGIDCPLGWPDKFVDFITAHRTGHVAVPGGSTDVAWRRQFTMRVTDYEVKEVLDFYPLSVSANLIGSTALRCAALLAELARQGQPVDRSGTGVVAEVYPAASLRRWGLPHGRYKSPANREGLARLVDELQEAAPWLDLGEHERTCRTSDHATDAVIAALTARAAAQGLVNVPTQDQAHSARSEGWIALPSGPLSELLPAG